MAKQSGLGFTLTVDDSTGTSNTNIANDVTNLQFATPRGVQDVTGIDKSAMERLLLLADFSITLNLVFNAALSHGVFRTVSSTSVARATALGIASQTLTCEVLYSDYPLTRSASGEFTASVPGVLTGGAVPTWGP